MRLTRTILLVCVCYGIFVMPLTIFNLVDSRVTHGSAYLALYCIYWTQYSFNFFVYAARNKPYRKAYIYALVQVLLKWRRLWKRNSRRPTSAAEYCTQSGQPSMGSLRFILQQELQGCGHCFRRAEEPSPPQSPKFRTHDKYETARF